MSDKKYGKVYLVGAGPGDIKLITVKGMECIKEADVIIYDYLANSKLLSYAKRDAEKIPVAKRDEKHHLDYDKIYSLLLAKVKEGKIIARLKGGDPFVFGRGGEEAEFLAEHNILFEVIPGVTSAIAVPAYAGIPVTHRKYAASLALITGHRWKKGENINWPQIARGPETLVFYMALSNLAYIKDRLLNEGKDKNTPTAVISFGTRSSQVTIVGTLENILDKVKESNLQPPAITVIGEVVNLRNKLRWFDVKPLFGKKIVITRAQDQAGEFAEELEKEGAEVIEFPTIEIIPAKDYKELDEALENINKYNWIIFTSVNGVKYFFDRLKSKKKDIRILSNVKLCAIGPKTSEELEKKGLNVDYVPSEYKAEGIIAGFEKMESVKNLKILLPRAALAREILPEKMKELGAHIDVITVYETILPSANTEYLKEKLINKEIDLITFTSSSTVNNFVEIFIRENIKIIDLLKTCKIAAIGPITKDTAQKIGLKIDFVPEKYTIKDFIKEIKNFYKDGRR
ncbi:uroporphyrinogen-III C-methyltransferase [Candidatus Poribacteria bacterium]|nr:uroporphyrinogen-III C-methyltransferase [Candidatus Poribacteria bacterium]